jgi:hypothetical protein
MKSRGGSPRGAVDDGRLRDHSAADRGYWPCIGGLDGRVSAFDANHNDSTGPAEPTPGAAWYRMIGAVITCAET